MPTFIDERLELLGQKQLSTKIYSRLFKGNVLFAMLNLFNGPKDVDHESIGIPDVMTTRNLSGAQVRQLAGLLEYKPVIHTATSDGSKVMGVRDTLPSEPTPTLTSPDLHYGTAGFRMFRIATPVQVWRSSIEMAKRDSGAIGQRGLAVLNVFNNALDEKMAVHIDSQLSPRLWGGAVSNQDAVTWDGLLGIDKICGSTNIYGRIDRADPVCPSSWKGNTVTTSKPAIFTDLIEQTKYNLDGSGVGIAKYGDDVQCVLTGSALFYAARKELLAKGATIVNNSRPDFAKWGVKQEILQYGNTWIAMDPSIPTQTTTGQWAAFLNLDSFTVIFDPAYKGKKTPWKYLPDYAAGAQEAYACEIISQLIFACEKPAVNTLYTNVTA